MRPSRPSSRTHLPPLARDRAQRLLHAVEEMRALDRARQAIVAAGRRADAHATPDAGSTADDLARRVEAKAREIFRLAQTEDDSAEGPSRRRRSHGRLRPTH